MNQSLRFDKKDRDLLVKINEVIDSGNVSSAEHPSLILDFGLNPRPLWV